MMKRKENTASAWQWPSRDVKTVLCLLLLLTVQTVMAFDYKGISYTINSDGKTVTATGLGSNAAMPTTLIIPDYAYNGETSYAVTAVGAKAFYASTEVHKVVIGDNVTTIGTEAFYEFGYNGNDMLLVLGKNITSLGSKAFWSYVWYGTREGQTSAIIVKGDDPTVIRLDDKYAPIRMIVYVKDEATCAKFKSDSYWKKLDNQDNNRYEYPIPVELNVKGGYWQTALLPEDLTQDQIESYFGQGTKVARLSENKYQWETPSAPYIVRFDLQQGMKASDPVLIKPTNDYWYVTNAAYTGTPVVTMTDEEHQIKVNMIGALADYNLDFGQIYLRNQDGKMQFFMADNDESNPEEKSDVWVKRGKCYFEMRDADGNLLYDIPETKVEVQQNTTAIRDISRTDSTRNTAVYSLTGQYEGTTLEGLTKGIHIVNGRKVVVK